MAAVESFDPPVVPQLDNSSGLPQPPSGLHPSTSPQAEFIETGPGWHAQPPAGAGTNVSVDSE